MFINMWILAVQVEIGNRYAGLLKEPDFVTARVDSRVSFSNIVYDGFSASLASFLQARLE